MIIEGHFGGQTYLFVKKLKIWRTNKVGGVIWRTKLIVRQKVNKMADK